MHKLYEQARELADDDPRHAEIGRQMANLAATIPVPRGLDGVR